MTSQLVVVKPNRPKLSLPASFGVNNVVRDRALRHYKWRFTLTLQVDFITNRGRMRPRGVLVPDTAPVQHARVVSCHLMTL